MNWQNSGYNLGDATLRLRRTGLSCRALSRCISVPVVRLGLGSHNQTPPHTSLDDGQGLRFHSRQ